MGILADLDYALAGVANADRLVIQMNPGVMHALAVQCPASYEAGAHLGIPIVPADHIEGWEIAEAA